MYYANYIFFLLKQFNCPQLALSLIFYIFMELPLYNKVPVIKLDILMQIEKEVKSFSRFLSEAINQVISTSHLSTLQHALLQLENNENIQMLQSQTQTLKKEVEHVDQKLQDQTQKKQEITNKEVRITFGKSQKLEQIVQPHIQVKQEQKQIPIFQSATKQLAQIKQRQPLSQPPLISSKRNYTEQSSQKSKTNQKESAHGSRKGKRKSSQQQSINLQLTQKTKNNHSFNQGKLDSLLYSDATLMYSNDTGFGKDVGSSHQERIEQKLILNKIESGEQEINANIERAESRQYNRTKTQSQKVSQSQKAAPPKFQRILLEKEQAAHNVFTTEINEYKGKISKIRELKESKKKQLQIQLRRINEELQQLIKKQHQSNSNNPIPNDYQSRVKISDNLQAKVKAQRFVRELKYQKKSRQDAHLGQLQSIDKNINNYMEELMKERYKNQQRIKQRKKLEIIERMKQQEMRKIEEQKQKDKNLKFVHQLKGSNSKNNLQVPKKSHQYQLPTHNDQQVKSKERVPTKKSELTENKQITPELSRKKAYFKKIRNLSFKKDKPDAYEQSLN